MVCY